MGLGMSPKKTDQIVDNTKTDLGAKYKAILMSQSEGNSKKPHFLPF